MGAERATGIWAHVHHGKDYLMYTNAPRTCWAGYNVSVLQVAMRY